MNNAVIRQYREAHVCNFHRIQIHSSDYLIRSRPKLRLSLQSKRCCGYLNSRHHYLTINAIANA